MKYTGLDKYVDRQVMCESKESTRFRLEAMLSYAERVFKSIHTNSVQMLLVIGCMWSESFCLIAKQIDIEFLFSVIIYKSNILHTTW